MDTRNVSEFVPLFKKAFDQVKRTLKVENTVDIFDSKGVMRGTIYMYQPDRIFYGGAIDWEWLGFDCSTVDCSDRMEFMQGLGLYLERREMYSFCKLLSHQN